jgi:hypothetical protein
MAERKKHSNEIPANVSTNVNKLQNEVQTAMTRRYRDFAPDSRQYEAKLLQVLADIRNRAVVMYHKKDNNRFVLKNMIAQGIQNPGQRAFIPAGWRGWFRSPAVPAETYPIYLLKGTDDKYHALYLNES